MVKFLNHNFPIGHRYQQLLVYIPQQNLGWHFPYLKIHRSHKDSQTQKTHLSKDSQVPLMSQNAHLEGVFPQVW